MDALSKSQSIIFVSPENNSNTKVNLCCLGSRVARAMRPERAAPSPDSSSSVEEGLVLGLWLCFTVLMEFQEEDRAGSRERSWSSPRVRSPPNCSTPSSGSVQTPREA